MLKFFRKIRRKLIDEGNLKRYLLYGFGEIILVVIGILIAVSLNNWNQHRIRNAEIEILLDKVEDDLTHNIKKMNEVIQDYHINDSLTKKVINNEVTIADYYSDERLANLLFRIQFLKLNTENISKLLDDEEVISSKYEVALKTAKELIKSIIYNENTEASVKDFYRGNIDFLTSRGFWSAKSDSTSIAKRFHFFATDENYKKRVLNLWAKTSEMALTTMYHRSISMQLLGKIKVIRHDYDASRLHQLYNSLNLNSFNQIECIDTVTRNKNQFYKNERFLVSNMGKKETHIVIKNSTGDIIGERKIKPGDYTIFMETSLQFGAIDDDYFSIIELHQDGKCTKKYVEETNGYVIIE